VKRSVSKSNSESDSDKRGIKRLNPLELGGRVPWFEIRRQMVTSLATAFGVVIGFVWTQVVVQAFTTAGLIINGSIPTGNWGNWFGFALGAVIVTFMCVIGMLLMARAQTRMAEKMAQK
jgi:hypothetical protein